jgi:hypothetical protein
MRATNRRMTKVEAFQVLLSDRTNQVVMCTQLAIASERAAAGC